LEFIGLPHQTSNKDNFLSLDFGLKEFGVVDSEERLKRYRRYVYEAGVLGRSGKTGAGVIDNSVLKKEREKYFELKRIQRLNQISNAKFYSTLSIQRVSTIPPTCRCLSRVYARINIVGDAKKR
jgi:hypothetical protein